MYEVMEKPDEYAILENGVVAIPLVTIKDSHGGVSHIIIDNGCYVLLNKGWGASGPSGEPVFKMVTHWYKVAAAALSALLEAAREPVLEGTA